MMIPIEEKMPAKIRRLPELAYNLWWSWHPEARALFRRLDLTLWRSSHHNPVLQLEEVRPERLEAVANDPAFCMAYNKVLMKLDSDLENGHTWFYQTFPELRDKTVAYFSAEFGLHNSLPLYSGGLGILAGDHAKEASDLGIPLVGVGFMYPQGYFRQHVPSHGWQEAVYQQLDINQAPIRPAVDADGKEVRIQVPLAGHTVYARVWHVQVGRVPLYLMDTDVDDNDPWNRELSARLYSGDNQLRIRQEIMLGIGGVRVLRALGIHPAVWHMNEGHSAFLVLELIREKVAAGLAFEEAVAQVKAAAIFTTHTPVPAGHDVFPFFLVEQYFSGYWEELGITREQLFDLGKHQESWGPAFNMTVLALRMAGQSNAVSQLHGKVSRAMWRGVWPRLSPTEETPISHITNGIHLSTWIAGELYGLFTKYLSPDWIERQDDPAIWQRLNDVPDNVLWQLHLELKRKLLHNLSELVRRRWVAGTNDPTQVLTSGTLLDPEALTIGFARRFATYKRATLIFRDLPRLQRILLDSHRPVQIIFAGKAHPADDPAKTLIQTVYSFAKHHQMGGRVAFIEDYDMHLARYLVQGVDVWLNNPRRPREASGTSGQKASLNGIPNLSVLDGWWAEGYNGANGWAIGQGLDVNSPDEQQDEEDANSLYQLLEEEIVPLYYARDRDNVPRGWVEIMRETIRSTAPHFSTRRMVKEYTTKMYIQAMRG
ncbi:MAG: alpha-glucan family phosphorylase [Chloroflexota bacterium]